MMPEDIIKQAAEQLLGSIQEEEALERSIPNDAAWDIIEQAERLAKKILALDSVKLREHDA